MNTNSKLLPGEFLGMSESEFDNISQRFWREAEQQKPEDRQLKFRLMWLGEWLQRTHNWSIQHHRCTPVQALQPKGSIAACLAAVLFRIIWSRIDGVSIPFSLCWYSAYTRIMKKPSLGWLKIGPLQAVVYRLINHQPITNI